MARQEPGATSQIQKELHPAEALDMVFDRRQRVRPDTTRGSCHEETHTSFDLTPRIDIRVRPALSFRTGPHEYCQSNSTI
jgi:hypothetical protein